MLQSVKIGGSLTRRARFEAPTVSRLESLVCLWLDRVYGGSCKSLLVACCKLCKLPEVSREMLVLMLLRVSSRVSGFPVASPCLPRGSNDVLGASLLHKAAPAVFCICVAWAVQDCAEAWLLQ